MNWYKVWMAVPGTDGDAENGPCEPQWWNDMVQAEDEPTAVAAANARARALGNIPMASIPAAESLERNARYAQAHRRSRMRSTPPG